MKYIIAAIDFGPLPAHIITNQELNTLQDLSSGLSIEGGSMNLCEFGVKGEPLA